MNPAVLVHQRIVIAFLVGLRLAVGRGEAEPSPSAVGTGRDSGARVGRGVGRPGG